MGFCTHGYGPILTAHLWPVSKHRVNGKISRVINCVGKN